MGKFKVVYFDSSDEEIPYNGRLFDSEEEAELFIDSNYSNDIGSDIRINSDGYDEWYTKTGVWNPEENEYFPSAYVEPVEDEVDESYKRIQ